MSATLLDLSEKPDLIWLARLIADVQRAAPEADFMLAGAQARDVLLMHAYGIDTRRATEDVDLAFLVANWDGFDLLRTRLIDSGRFAGTTMAPYKLRHNGVGAARVDLIPFAGVEDVRRAIAWPPDGAIVMNVMGFREARNAAISIALPERISVMLPPIQALALLKLSAWKDRRLHFPLGKDAHDIRLLLKYYLEAGNQERLYSEASHLLERADFEFEVAGAWLLGNDARMLLEANATSSSTVPFYSELLQQENRASTESLLLADMRSPDPAHDLRLLRSFCEGFGV